MKVIGIDVNALTRPNRTGVEQYVFALVHAMMRKPLKEGERVVLYASSVVDDLGVLPEGWSWRIITWPLPKGWTHGRLSLELFFRTPDVFFSPGHEVPLLSGRTKIVSTVHDLAFLRRPDLYPPTGNLRQQWAVKQNIQQAGRLIAISHVTKSDLIELMHVPDQKIDVIPLARVKEAEIRSDALKQFTLQEKNYFLSIGRLEKKKNIAFLVRAFSDWKQKTGDTHKLVLGGSWGWGKEEIEQAIAISNVKNDIILTGYLSEQDKTALMQQATAYCFPSNYEGFGMPTLDAFHYRIPLIVNDLPIFHEVAGDAARYCHNLSDWTQAFSEAVSGDLDDLVERGVDRLGKFSWDQVGAETWKTVRACYE